MLSFTYFSFVMVLWRELAGCRLSSRRTGVTDAFAIGLLSRSAVPSGRRWSAMVFVARSADPYARAPLAYRVARFCRGDSGLVLSVVWAHNTRAGDGFSHARDYGHSHYACLCSGVCLRRFSRARVRLPVYRDD